MYDTKKVAFFCFNNDPVLVNLQSHVIYQFECPGCKAKHIAKTDRCLQSRLNEHSDFRTSAVGKHLYECEHFHHIVNLFNISVYFNSEPSFIQAWYHISSAISRNTRIIEKISNWTQLCFFGVSLYQMTESHPQCRHQSHQRTKSFRIGPIVLLLIFPLF